MLETVAIALLSIVGIVISLCIIYAMYGTSERYKFGLPLLAGLATAHLYTNTSLPFAAAFFLGTLGIFILSCFWLQNYFAPKAAKERDENAARILDQMQWENLRGVSKEEQIARRVASMIITK